MTRPTSASKRRPNGSGPVLNRRTHPPAPLPLERVAPFPHDSTTLSALFLTAETSIRCQASRSSALADTLCGHGDQVGLAAIPSTSSFACILFTCTIPTDYHTTSMYGIVVIVRKHTKNLVCSTYLHTVILVGWLAHPSRLLYTTLPLLDTP